MFKVFFCDSINLCYSISVKQRNTKKKSSIKQTRIYNYLHHNCRCSSPANVLRGGRKFDNEGRTTHAAEEVNKYFNNGDHGISIDSGWEMTSQPPLLAPSSTQIPQCPPPPWTPRTDDENNRYTFNYYSLYYYYYLNFTHYTMALVITPTVASILNHYQYSRTIEVIRGDPLVVLENQQTTAV